MSEIRYSQCGHIRLFGGSACFPAPMEIRALSFGGENGVAVVKCPQTTFATVWFVLVFVPTSTFLDAWVRYGDN